MNEARKKFSPHLHARHDGTAKNVAMQWLESQGHESVVENPDPYGVDVLYELDGSSMQLECEVKLSWKGPKFPYATIQVMGRKQKYFNEGADLFMLNATGDAAFFIANEAILTSPPKIVPNKYVSEGEWFYDVPVENALYIKVTRAK